MAEYLIRTMRRAELDLAVEWAAAEGWNPGFADADCFVAADPHGFLVGVLDGEPIASISVVKYDHTFGFLGLYIVKPGYRGQGYGLAIWQAGLAYLAGCTVGLDGVLAQQANYQKSGFALAYRNIRYAGRSGGAAPGDPALVPLHRLPFAMVEAYDRRFFPAPRRAFLRAWISQPGCRAFGVRRAGGLAGYGVIRPCRSGYKIGPLFAATAPVAHDLYQSLTAAVEPDQPVFLDVPEVNAAALALAADYQLSPVFETARMYTGACPELALDQLYGVTSFELG